MAQTAGPANIFYLDGDEKASLKEITRKQANSINQAFINLDLQDTGVITSGIITEVAGWNIVSTGVRKVGPLIQLGIRAERTGGTINNPSSGNIVNSRVADLHPDWAPADGMGYDFTSLNSASTGRTCSGTIYTNDTPGIYLVAFGGTSDIKNGEDITLAGTYLAKAV